MHKLFFQIMKFNEIKTYTFQVEAFCLCENFIHLIGKQNCRFIKSQNEQQE